jgi:hypothetical protein
MRENQAEVKLREKKNETVFLSVFLSIGYLLDIACLSDHVRVRVWVCVEGEITIKPNTRRITEDEVMNSSKGEQQKNNRRRNDDLSNYTMRLTDNNRLLASAAMRAEYTRL